MSNVPPTSVSGSETKFGGEGPERGVAQHQGEAERAEDLRQHRAFGDVAHQAEVDRHAEQEHSSAAAPGTKKTGPQFQQGEREERRIHRQHDEVAMGEVDDVHHAPDQGEARGEQSIDRSPSAGR